MQDIEVANNPPMEPFRTFETLECRQAARDLRILVKRVAADVLPKEEEFRLRRSQILNAARSCTANTAEGYGRFHYADQLRFLRMSRGSQFEVLDHAITACDDGFIKSSVVDTVREAVPKAVALTNGYARYLHRLVGDDARVREKSDPLDDSFFYPDPAKA